MSGGAKIYAAALLFAFAACAPPQARPSPTAQDVFFENLAALCGQSFPGRLVSQDPGDAELAGEALVLEVRDCTAREIRAPFHVGADHSRTWVITRTHDGLRLKHDHRHADGGEDVLSQYGGDTVAEGSATRQQFPADQASKDLFIDQGIAQSASNVWAIEVHPGASYVYELRREGRHFRVEFDLTAPVAPPGAADPGN